MRPPARVAHKYSSASWVNVTSEVVESDRLMVPETLSVIVDFEDSCPLVGVNLIESSRYV